MPMTEDNLATGQKASKSSVTKDVKQTDFVIVVFLRGCTDVCLCEPVCAVMFECVCGCVCVRARYQQHAGLLPRQAFSRLLFLLLPLSIRHSHSQTHTYTFYISLLPSCCKEQTSEGNRSILNKHALRLMFVCVCVRLQTAASPV